MRAVVAEGRDRYTPLARLLHWVMAVMVATMFALGIWMSCLPPAGGAAAHSLFNLHESLGVSVLLLVFLRFAVRLMAPPPPLPGSPPVFVRAAAPVNHLLLYALLFFLPVVGYLANSAQGVRLVWFGWLPLPALQDKNAVEAGILASLHAWGALLLFSLIALHAAAVWYHMKRRRDGLLRRML